MKKLYPDARAALQGALHDGMVIMSGGFGLCGIPSALIKAIRDSGVTGPDHHFQQCGHRWGRAWLAAGKPAGEKDGQLLRGGEQDLPMNQYLAGELEIEFNPQGTLAERIRAGGGGHSRVLSRAPAPARRWRRARKFGHSTGMTTSWSAA